MGNQNFSHVFQLYDTIHTNFVLYSGLNIIFFCYTNKKNLKFKKFLNKKQIASYIGKCMYTKIRYLWIKVNKNETWKKILYKILKHKSFHHSSSKDNLAKLVSVLTKKGVHNMRKIWRLCIILLKKTPFQIDAAAKHGITKL